MCVPENCVVQEVFLRSHSQAGKRKKKTHSVVGAEADGRTRSTSVDDVKNVRSVVLLYGLEDEWRKEFEEEGATYCGEPWSCLFARTGLEVKKMFYYFIILFFNSSFFYSQNCCHMTCHMTTCIPTY